MPVYEYTALDRAGKNIAGIIDADSAAAARQKLRSSGKYPVEVKETTSKAKSEVGTGFSLPSVFNRVTADDIHALTRQLATLLNAGIPLVATHSCAKMSGPLPTLSVRLAIAPATLASGI